MNQTKKNKLKNIHSGHRKRLRKVFNNSELANMPEHQLLELMISFVQPQKDINPTAHLLISEFGSLANVLDAEHDDLCKVKGVGEVTASFINFCSRLPEIYKSSKAKSKVCLETPGQIVNFFREAIEVGIVEKFYFVCLNSKGEVLCFKNIGKGSVSNLYVNKRELMQYVLKYPTHSVIICHTHASGKPSPSKEDLDFTKNLCAVMSSLNIRLCDHIIISPEGHYSFYQNKILGSFLNKNDIENLKMNIFDFGYGFSQSDVLNFDI